jgi:ATP-dependent RNA helicase DDX41
MTDDDVDVDSHANKPGPSSSDDKNNDELTSWQRKKALRQQQRRQQQQDQDQLEQLETIDDSTIQQAVPDGGSNSLKRKRQLLEQEILLSKKTSQRHNNANSINPTNQSDVDHQKSVTFAVDHPSTTADHNNDENRDSEGIKHNNAAAVNKDDGTSNTTTTPEVVSLLDRVAMLQKQMSTEERMRLAQQEEETRILREATKVSHNALLGASEIAHDTKYTRPMPSTWTIPEYMRTIPESTFETIRNEWHMQVQGNDVPPPMKRFSDMRLPTPILHYLQEVKLITKPTPIQIQGLPVALAGRDMIGIAFTGSGKTLTFSLPLVMMALEEEFRMPLLPQEGPIGIILAPSRELARQTYDLVNELCNALQTTATTTTTGDTSHKTNNSNNSLDGRPKYPMIRSQLMIGGESVRDQVEIVRTHGVHCIVATPGRLRDVLKRRQIHLINCRYICLDEADRMLDMGFDEEVGEIMNYFTHQRQTLLFSATFPKKFQDFAQQTLVQPIIVNVGRAGAANLDVIQEVEYVKEEAKIVYLLHCLQKTAPPVIIFCERTGSVDDIYEYLLLKGVESVSIHGGKDQEERNDAIQQFKAGHMDVLIATDIAAKGLDFPAIQHVINYDMPNEIENYVHRIGRTGRAGKTGVATTFINKSCDETTLLDLKALLQEAKQRIPPVLMMLDDPRDAVPNSGTQPPSSSGGTGCSFCGGLGHTIVDCPKIDKDARRVAGSHRDVLAGGGGDW